MNPLCADPALRSRTRRRATTRRHFGTVWLPVATLDRRNLGKHEENGFRATRKYRNRTEMQANVSNCSTLD